jgi:zinc protease
MLPIFEEEPIFCCVSSGTGADFISASGMSFRLLFVIPLVANLPLHAEVAGFTRIQQVKGITEYRLDANGLTVLLLPEHSAPAVTFMVTYRIGSRNESYGTTGATHLLEHLMFKGTQRYNKEAGTSYDQVLERTGAQVNATTSFDRTNYFATLGPQDLPRVIELEGDRMRNLRLREEDRQPEMTVVRNEFERGENDPATVLLSEVWSTAYLAHPYHHNVLGWRSDVENVPIEKLRAFYDAYYWPDNATVSVIGDFQPAAVLELIQQSYGKISKAPEAIPRVYTEEPPQSGPRRVVVKRPGELGLVSLAFKSPPAHHPDYPVLTVLSDLLANGRNSRFHVALTDPGLTTEVGVWPEFTLDPSLVVVIAQIAPEASHQHVEDKLLEVIASIREQGVTEGEVRAAISRLTAQSAYARDGSFQRASVLNECIAVGDWTLYHRHDEAVAQVTAADVQRVAKRWLVSDRSTTGWYIPQAAPAEVMGAVAQSAVESAPAAHSPVKEASFEGASKAAGVAEIAPQVIRSPAGGFDLLVCPTGVKDVVTLLGGIPFGEPDQQVLAEFAAGMLERGTLRHDAASFAALLDEVGATIEFRVSEDSLEFTARCLKKDLSLVVGLLADALRSPAFSDVEIEKLRLKLTAAAMQERVDTDAQAVVAFSRAAFPVGHPNRKPSAEEVLTRLKAISRDQLLEFQRQWLGPEAATLVAVGDVDPALLTAEVESSFGGWTGGRRRAVTAVAPELTGPVELRMPIAGKESVTVMLGQASGLSFRDPDTLPLALATSELGQGFTSRLLSTVRDSEGLTYGVNAALMGNTQADGAWGIFATFAPQLLDRGIASIQRELDSWHRDGLTAAQLAYRQSALIGHHRVSLATTEGLAAALLSTVRRGLPVTWLDEYPAQISALSLTQVNEVIRRRLDPTKMIVVKSGSLP